MCNNHGTLVIKNNETKCKCDTGFNGDLCETTSSWNFVALFTLYWKEIIVLDAIIVIFILFMCFFKMFRKHRKGRKEWKKVKDQHLEQIAVSYMKGLKDAEKSINCDDDVIDLTVNSDVIDFAANQSNFQGSAG